MAQVAFYPGTFDPVTNGHLDLINAALALADRVVIGVGVNAGKSPLFSLDERLRMVEQTIAALPGEAARRVSAVSFEGLTVEAARSVGAVLIVRGVRDSSDFDYEMQMAAMNRDLAPDLQTVLVPARPAVRHISATLVRQIASHGADVSAFVPPGVAAAIAKRLPR